ncbi:MAG TPA: hypothetical protein VEN31_01830 [Candidatus Bathyarchaeia archaeon]|nr:hypothetical protein [Candidatus Bathyarchaeia archaeon]
MTFRRLLLFIASIGSGVIAVDTAVRYAAPTYAVFGASLYVVAAVFLAAAGVILARDPARARRLAVGGAIVLASWVVAIGYGGFELATRVVAVFGIAAAAVSLVGATRHGAALGVGALLVASVPLMYVLLVHPPLGLIAIYAVAALGFSAAALGLLPAPALRLPLLAQGAIALAAWLLAGLALLLAFGPPLSST